MTDDDLPIINGICEAFLRRFDYPLERSVEEANSNGAIAHSTGSGYVERLIAEARRDYHLQQQNATG
jgi:hypothetical protein